MKKNIKAVLFCSMFLLGTSITIEAQGTPKGPVIVPEGETYYACTGSDDPAENRGKCRALSSGNGAMCFTFGTGTACNGITTIP